MFQGESAVTIDDKGRMSIPTAHRDAVAKHSANRLVVTYNPFEPDSLWIFPVGEWERVRDQVMALTTAKAVHRNLQRKLVGAAAAVEVDANGRLQLPFSQRETAGLQKRAVLVGMGSKFELWNEKGHLDKIRETIAEDQVTAEMHELNL